MEASDIETPCKGEECRDQRAHRQEKEARQAIVEARSNLKAGMEKLDTALAILATFGEVPFDDLERD